MGLERVSGAGRHRTEPEPISAHTFRANDLPANTKLFVTQPASEMYDEHVHHYSIGYEDYSTLNQGGIVHHVITEKAHHHTHSLTPAKEGSVKYLIQSCDGLDMCFDGHGQRVYPI